jgi:hypothetical protein
MVILLAISQEVSLLSRGLASKEPSLALRQVSSLRRIFRIKQKMERQMTRRKSLLATARRDDPLQCFAAADKVNEHISEACMKSLNAVMAHPGLTRKELRLIMNDINDNLGKRMKNLEDAGLIFRRPDPITGEFRIWPKQPKQLNLPQFKDITGLFFKEYQK